MKKFSFTLATIAATLVTAQVSAVQWVRNLDGSTTSGTTGTITLDDWDFVGPQGRQADSFAPWGGQFGNGAIDTMGKAYCLANPTLCGIGQIQHVITSGPDGITPDARANILDDFRPDTGNFPNANVDSLTTFYLWGYTTAPGSTFNNMMIDLDGDYFIPQEDMLFEWYNGIDYTQVVQAGETRVGSNPDGTYNNSLGFQPYALSDGIGWCGSVIASHPNAHEAMAGQVKFDIAMDVYNRAADGTLSYFSTEVTTDFEMRSFGNIVVDLTDASGTNQFMSAQAVINNTDASVAPQAVGPSTPVGDFSWHNRVSFMGANILPAMNYCGIETAEWISGARGIGVKRYASLRKDLTTQTDCEAAGGVWDYNAFAGYGYILRADGNRYIDFFDETVYGTDPMTVDGEGDGFPDTADNCSDIANPTQQDTDGDQIGNACDADFNNDNFVNSLDIGLFKAMFFATGDVEGDLNGDNIVNSLDLGLFKSKFFNTPGPSGLVRP